MNHDPGFAGVTMGETEQADRSEKPGEMTQFRCIGKQPRMDWRSYFTGARVFAVILLLAVTPALLFFGACIFLGRGDGKVIGLVMFAPMAAISWQGVRSLWRGGFSLWIFALIGLAILCIILYALGSQPLSGRN